LQHSSPTEKRGDYVIPRKHYHIDFESAGFLEVAYGDGEYAVMVVAKGQKGNQSADWSKGGKQW
jgi:hypothetical protein